MAPGRYPLVGLCRQAFGSPLDTVEHLENVLIKKSLKGKARSCNGVDKGCPVPPTSVLFTSLNSNILGDLPLSASPSLSIDAWSLSTMTVALVALAALATAGVASVIVNAW